MPRDLDKPFLAVGRPPRMMVWKGKYSLVGSARLRSWYDAKDEGLAIAADTNNSTAIVLTVTAIRHLFPRRPTNRRESVHTRTPPHYPS